MAAPKGSPVMETRDRPRPFELRGMREANHSARTQSPGRVDADKLPPCTSQPLGLLRTRIC